jgi:hypothetical protein
MAWHVLIVDRVVVAVALTSSKGTTIKRKTYDETSGSITHPPQ